MELKIGDKVKTNGRHDKLYKFGFEGIINDIQSDTAIVYGNVIKDLKKSNDKSLRYFSLDEITHR